MCVMTLDFVASVVLEYEEQVSNTVPAMASDAATKLWDDTINRRLFDLVHSQTNVEKLGGILAIGEQSQHCGCN